jgi:Tfp pilus assembly protein PilN
MKAVNLLPADTRRGLGGGGVSLSRLQPIHAVLAVLVILLAYVTVYVLTSNTISNRKAQLASLQAQLTAQQAAITRLSTYTQFQKLADQRAATVKAIAASRFDWHGALSDLSKVMPANASIQSLLATVGPGASAAGPGGSTAGSAASAGSVRGAISAPAFEIKGCTATQDDVARLISRLRLINDVQRVTLEDSTRATPTAAPGAPSTPAASSTQSSGGCPATGPSFDLVVFFNPLPGALGSASAAGRAAPATPTALAHSTAAQASTTPTAPSSSQPVSTGTPK